MYAIRSYYDYLVSCDEKDVGVMASIMGKKNTVRKLKKVEAVEPSLLKYENKAFLAKDVLAAVNNNPDAKKLMVETASKIVITSYSIHYTKLYETQKEKLDLCSCNHNQLRKQTLSEVLN